MNTKPSDLFFRLIPGLALIALVMFSQTMTNATAQPALEQPDTDAMLEAYGKLPLSFEANQGQTDEQVKFMSRGSGYNLFLTSTEAVLTLRKAAETEPVAGVLQESQPIEYELLHMQFVNANPAPQVLGLEQLPGKVNYFLGSDPAEWNTDIPTFARVAYQGVYPGVDLTYYGNNQGQLEYDLIVAPGADPDSILLGFAGAESLSIDAQGDLVLNIAGGEIRQPRPLVFQELGGVRQEIAGRYVLMGANQVGIAVEAYDPGKALVIDPVLIYSTFLGGSGNDQGSAIAVDSAGNAYVTGQTASVDFPTALGALDTTFNGVIDAFVTKLNPAGTGLVYSTYLGGSGHDQGSGSTSNDHNNDIAVDSAGSAYVAGTTTSLDFPTTPGAFDTTFGNNSDAFVTKLDPTGSALVYSTYLGGSGEDRGFGIALDSALNAYVTGLTEGGVPTTPGAFDTTFGGFYDAFITKFDTTGSALVYSTYLGGGNDDRGYSIAVDSTLNAYLTGQTVGGVPATAGAYDTTYGGGVSDVFVTKFNPLGSALVYSSFVGGTGNDFSYSIALDSTGSAYVTGITSGDFPTTPGAFDTTYGGFDDAFVTKLNPAGSALGYSTYLGDGNSEVGTGIAVDSTFNAHVTGATNGAFPTTPDGFDLSFNGSNDAFVTKLDTTGASLVYSTYLGGSSQDFTNGIALDSAGSAYVTGRTDSIGFPTAPGAFDITFNGVSDAFITKLEIAPPATDSDGDGVPDVSDNCPTTPNPGQEDADGDGQGDACDPFPNDPDNDVDGDGVGGDVDNCPTIANADQANFDGDSQGDACDADDDNDGVNDNSDAFPFDPTEWEDTDGDNIGNNADADDDNDGQSDADEITCGSDSLDAGSLSPDNDSDNSPDCVDADDDNDGVADTSDNCVFVANPSQSNIDGDSLGDACDPLSYNFTGFFSPVDNTPVFNLVNAGRSIPVKFSLGSNQGLDIFFTGYPKSQNIPCDGGASVDPVEETTTANQGLTYDPVSNQYNYVWKTQKSWAGTCRKFILGLKDGSTHEAYFKFK